MSIVIDCREAVRRTGANAGELDHALRSGKLSPCEGVLKDGGRGRTRGYFLHELKKRYPKMEAPELDRQAPPEEEESAAPSPFAISDIEWRMMMKMSDAEFSRLVEEYVRADPRAAEYFAKHPRPARPTPPPPRPVASAPAAPPPVVTVNLAPPPPASRSQMRERGSWLPLIILVTIGGGVVMTATSMINRTPRYVQFSTRPTISAYTRVPASVKPRSMVTSRGTGANRLPPKTQSLPTRPSGLTAESLNRASLELARGGVEAVGH